MNGETWKPAPGFLNVYVVSDLGRIRNICPPRGNGLLFGEIDRYGYRAVNLSLAGKKVKRRVHRLICEAFHGPPPEGCEVAHLDGNPRNNRADNLAWVTPKENASHKERHGTNHGNGGMPGERHPSAKLTEEQVSEIRASPLSSYKAAEQFGVSQTQIMRIRHGTRWTAPKGFARKDKQ